MITFDCYLKAEYMKLYSEKKVNTNDKLKSLWYNYLYMACVADCSLYHCFFITNMSLRKHTIYNHDS